MLCRWGARVDMRNKRGRSPLGEAILNNKPACAELLVDAGAKMSNVNQSIALSIALISMSLTSLGTLRSICSVRRAYLTLDWLAEKTCVLAPMRDYMYDSCTLLPSHCTTLYVGVGLAPPPIPRQNRGKTGIFLAVISGFKTENHGHFSVLVRVANTEAKPDPKPTPA